MINYDYKINIKIDGLNHNSGFFEEQQSARIKEQQDRMLLAEQRRKLEQDFKNRHLNPLHMDFNIKEKTGHAVDSILDPNNMTFDIRK